MSEEKTEKPTRRKLRRAREKGSVSKSKDVAVTVTVSAVFIMFWITGPYFFQNLISLMQVPQRYFASPFNEALPLIIRNVFIRVAGIIVPIIFIVFFLGILAHMIQFGAIFAIKQITPDVNRINPFSKIKQMFSLSKLTELIKTFLKIGLLLVISYFIIKAYIPALALVPFWGIGGSLKLLFSIMKIIIIVAMILFTIVAIFDVMIQKQLFLHQNKMTKEEFKRDRKDQEGDPQIKGKRKGIHRDIVVGPNWKSVKKADVVVTNPTHIAVALYYHKELTGLPRVVAKGKRKVAKKIVKIAVRAGVPIMQNVPLAHDLYNKVEIDDYIPNELFRPVAEVLRWVKQQNLKKKKVLTGQWYRSG